MRRPWGLEMTESSKPREKGIAFRKLMIAGTRKYKSIMAASFQALSNTGDWQG